MLTDCHATKKLVAINLLLILCTLFKYSCVIMILGHDMFISVFIMSYYVVVTEIQHAMHSICVSSSYCIYCTRYVYDCIRLVVLYNTTE